jgi:putative mycofactocin binding protein MftB
MLGFARGPNSAEPEGSDSVRLAQYVKFREEKFGGVLFETRSEKVFTLNPTATAVIREIASGDEATIATRLKDRFIDQGGAIEREVSAFLGELRQRGLIEG